jgi:hypothetical protein
MVWFPLSDFDFILHQHHTSGLCRRQLQRSTTSDPPLLNSFLNNTTCGSAWHPTTSKLSQTKCATGTNQQPGAHSSVDSGELLPGSILHYGLLGSEGHYLSWQPPSSTPLCHLGKCSFSAHLVCTSRPSFYFVVLTAIFGHVSHATEHIHFASHYICYVPSCRYGRNSIILQTPEMLVVFY